MNSGPALVLESVTKRYATVTAVDRLNLQVHAGSILGLLGPNGAGKTTTLRMILRILLPDEGHIRIFGRELDDSGQDLIGYLPEERGLYPRMIVREVLTFLGTLKGLSGVEALRRTDRWLERLGIAEWAHRRVQELSKGMQQKVQLIASLLHDPPLLVLDEPFMGLDPVNARLVQDCLLELHARGTTLILSTHRMDQVEMLCDAICLLHHGRAVLSGNLRSIKQSYGNNTLLLEFDGQADGYHLTPFASRINRQGRVIELRLKPGTDHRSVLQFLLQQGAPLTRFELIEPSLQDIFIETVQSSHA